MIEHERKGWVDAVTWRFSRVAMLLPAIIVAIMSYEVFMRYVLEKPTIWVNEMSLWMGGWVYLTAGIYAMQQRSHIRITVLYDIVPRWLRRFFDILSALLIVIWAFCTVWGGFNESWDALISWERFGTAWDPPIPATTQPLILVVMVIMAIQAVSNLFHDWSDGDNPVVTDEMQAEIEELKRAQGITDSASQSTTARH
ncbi:MAG: TRAP transporter small permease [Granulosicoccus sp.]|nr:TRAP transporter small permease [Granulosicoccus sp.]